MKTFVDSTGRAWTISMTIGEAARLRDALKVNILSPELDDVLVRLVTDDLFLFEVLNVLLLPQMEKYDIAAEEVRSLFDGGTLLRAHTALYEELLDFFRQRGRADRAQMVLTQTKLLDEGIHQAQSQLEEMDVVKTVSGLMSGKSQEPSGSPPAH